MKEIIYYLMIFFYKNYEVKPIYNIINKYNLSSCNGMNFKNYRFIWCGNHFYEYNGVEYKKFKNSYIVLKYDNFLINFRIQFNVLLIGLKYNDKIKFDFVILKYEKGKSIKNLQINKIRGRYFWTIYYNISIEVYTFEIQDFQLNLLLFYKISKNIRNISVGIIYLRNNYIIYIFDDNLKIFINEKFSNNFKKNSEIDLSLKKNYKSKIFNNILLLLDDNEIKIYNIMLGLNNKTNIIDFNKIIEIYSQKFEIGIDLSYFEFNEFDDRIVISIKFINNYFKIYELMKFKIFYNNDLYFYYHNIINNFPLEEEINKLNPDNLNTKKYIVFNKNFNEKKNLSFKFILIDSIRRTIVIKKFECAKFNQIINVNNKIKDLKINQYSWGYNSNEIINCNKISKIDYINYEICNNRNFKFLGQKIQENLFKLNFKMNNNKLTNKNELVESNKINDNLIFNCEDYKNIFECINKPICFYDSKIGCFNFISKENKFLKFIKDKNFFDIKILSNKNYLLDNNYNLKLNILKIKHLNEILDNYNFCGKKFIQIDDSILNFNIKISNNNIKDLKFLVCKFSIQLKPTNSYVLNFFNNYKSLYFFNYSNLNRDNLDIPNDYYINKINEKIKLKLDSKINYSSDIVRDTDNLNIIILLNNDNYKNINFNLKIKKFKNNELAQFLYLIFMIAFSLFIIYAFFNIAFKIYVVCLNVRENERIFKIKMFIAKLYTKFTFNFIVKRKIYKKIIFKEKNNPFNQKHCVICLEDFKKKEKLIMIRCKHLFHINCIESWRLNGLSPNNIKCPVCNISILF